MIERLGRFNAEHPWSHNDAYAGLLVRHARAVRRRGGDTAVDVGCGTGNLLARLARVLPNVIGVEPNAEAAAIAARRFEPNTVRIDVRTFGDEPDRAYDLISFVASLHHMPLRPTLVQAQAALRPGGRIVIVGVARETDRDRWRSIASLALNPIIGFLRHPARATALPASMTAPTAEATETFEEIATVMSEVLPGIRMRRRLFWRYTAAWVAPDRPAPDARA